jgi:nitroreductase
MMTAESPRGEAKGERSEILGELLQERFSCRGFLPDPVPRATIERIASIAQRTASWCNSQPWQVSIVSGEATDRLREELLRHVESVSPQPDFSWPGGYHGVYNERRRECGFQLYNAVGVARGDRAAADRQRLENFRFFGAPHVAIVSTDRELGVYGAIDCGAYVGNFAVAARALGVATIPQAALAGYPEFWREHLKLGEDRLIVCGISFGYEDPEHPANQFRTSRAAVSEAVSWIAR